VRAKSLQMELVARQTEETLLTCTSGSRVKKLWRDHSRMWELRGRYAAVAHRKQLL
jgi:hypothetical protein